MTYLPSLSLIKLNVVIIKMLVEFEVPWFRYHVSLAQGSHEVMQSCRTKSHFPLGSKETLNSTYFSVNILNIK